MTEITLRLFSIDQEKDEKKLYEATIDSSTSTQKTFLVEVSPKDGKSDTSLERLTLAESIETSNPMEEGSSQDDIEPENISSERTSEGEDISRDNVENENQSREIDSDKRSITKGESAENYPNHPEKEFRYNASKKSEVNLSKALLKNVNLDADYQLTRTADWRKYLKAGQLKIQRAEVIILRFPPNGNNFMDEIRTITSIVSDAEKRVDALKIKIGQSFLSANFDQYSGQI